jgi:hypothetical protein
LLDFEASHSQRSMRIRYEDLAGEGDRAASALSDFLGLDAGGLSALSVPSATPGDKRNDVEFREQLDRLPDRLRAKIGDLHARLGYPALI